MKIQVIGEDFSVTEAMNTQIQEKVDKISEHMKFPADFTVFLKKTSAYLFEVRIQTHSRGVDMSGEGTDKDFYMALNQAKKSMLRQIDDQHSRKVQARRHA